MHPCREESIYPVFHKTITPGPSAIHSSHLPCKTLCTTDSKHSIHLQMPLRMGLVCMKSHANVAANAIEALVCMKSEGNLDVNVIEEPGHKCFTFPLQLHNLLQPTTQQGASVPCNLKEGGKTKRKKTSVGWLSGWFLRSIKTHLIDQQIDINLCLIVPSGSCGLVGILLCLSQAFACDIALNS